MMILVCASAVCAQLMFAGCSDSQSGKVHRRFDIVALMDSAEAVMNDNSEYSLRIMDSIDSDAIKRKRLRARYALLYSEAERKQYIDRTDDSLIMIAVNYYSVHGDSYNRFTSYYDLGCIYFHSNRLTDAAVALLQAEQLLDDIDDDYREGLLYTQLGNVFFYSYDFHRAESYFRKAFEEYSAASMESHKYYALYNIGECLLQMKKYSESHALLEEVQAWARNSKDYQLLEGCLLDMLSCSIYAKNHDDADNEFNEYYRLFGIPDKKAKAICKIARYYILKNDLTTARTFADKAWLVSASSDSINLLYMESLFQEAMGRVDTSMTLYKQSIELQNRNLRLLLDQPVINAQKDYLKTVYELESFKLKNRNLLLMVFVLVVVLLIVCAVLINRNRHQKTEERIREYLFTINELTARDNFNANAINHLNGLLEESNASIQTDRELIGRLNEKLFELSARESINNIRIEKLNSKVRDMFRNQFSMSDYVYTRYYEQMDDKLKTERMYKIVKNQLDIFKSSTNIARLDALINESCNGIIERILSSHLDLKEKEMMLLRFELAGFSAKSIAAILGDSHHNINQRKKRLLDKIRILAPDVAIELDNLLNIS